MGLMIFHVLIARPPENYGVRVSWAGARPHRGIGKVALASAALIFCLVTSIPVNAQQASQPGFDPRQTEKHFDEPQSGLAPSGQSPTPRMPVLSRPQVGADSRPLFKLRGALLTGALAVPHEQITRVYQPYLGKKVSQADLSAIAAAIGDAYRAAGFHLSRAIVPPQDISDGLVRVQMIEGSIAEVALKGEE